MARRIRDAALETPTARSKLKPSGNPYYRRLDRGVHLGYRKGLGGGVWVVRRGTGDKLYQSRTLGAADDNQPANGLTILDFYQAQDLARSHAASIVDQERVAALGPAVTVASAIEAYLVERERREERQKDGVGLKRDSRSRLSRHVLTDPTLSACDLRALSEDTLATWRTGMAGKLAETSIRRTANDLKAALNEAAKRHRAKLPAHLPIVIKNGLAVPEAASPVARDQQILADSDVRRIVAAAREVDDAEGWDGDLFRLVVVLAATGARCSQLIRLTVADVQRAQSRLMIPASRKGRETKNATRIGFRVGDDVMEALRPMLAGRKGPDRLLLRPRWQQVEATKWQRVDRSPWKSAAEMTRPWSWIIEKAELPADIVPYSLRHSSIVRMLSAGLPIRLVAALHDTSSAMIERHYSAYIVDAMDELAAKAVVPLVSADVRNIRLSKVYT